MTDDFDEDDDTAIQLAINGLTIADDATPAQVAAALYARFGLDWCMALPNELYRQAAFEKVAKWKHRLQMPDKDKLLSKRGKGGRWVS